MSRNLIGWGGYCDFCGTVVDNRYVHWHPLFNGKFCVRCGEKTPEGKADKKIREGG